MMGCALSVLWLSLRSNPGPALRHPALWAVIAALSVFARSAEASPASTVRFISASVAPTKNHNIVVNHGAW